MIGIFQLDTRALALFRIALGFILLFDLGIRFGDLEAHYTDAGIAPRDALYGIAPIEGEPIAGSLHLSAHTASGSADWIQVLFAIQAGAAFLLLLGWRTRVMTVLCWFLWMSMQVRNPMVLNGADHLLRLLLLFSIFLPLGSEWSVDEKRGRGGQLPSPLAGLALLLQVCAMYVFTVWLKSDPAWRSEFTAGIIALQADFYVTPFGDWVSQLPRALKIATATVFGWEAVGPLLLLFGFPFRSLRGLVLLLFAALHVGMGLCFELGLWTWVTLAALLPFLPFHDLEPWTDSGSMDWNGWLAGLLLLPVFWINLHSVEPEKFPIPSVAEHAFQWMGLDQRWNMFAPYPIEDDGWFVASGRWKAGDPVNLLHPGLPVNESKPHLYSQEFTNHRWRKYFLRLRRDSAGPWVPHFTLWLMHHPGYFGAIPPSNPVHIDLLFFQEITDWDGTEQAPRPFVLSGMEGGRPLPP